MNNWDPKAKRFVLFFDILGFKNLVSKKNHNEIVKILRGLTTKLSILTGKPAFKVLKEHVEDICVNQTKSVTFSDSIIIFSKGNKKQDAIKIISDAYFILNYAFEEGIPIKGAISFGDITLDFENNLFFGQPIIDAFTLHEDLDMLSVIVDHNAEKKILQFEKEVINFHLLKDYEVNMKFGTVYHKLIKPLDENAIKNCIINISKMYLETSGRPRKYLDNTIKFYNYLIKQTAVNKG